VAVCIRLKRYGRTNRPFWRICATDRKTARDGRVIEELGHYDPLVANKDAIKIHRDRVSYWLKLGAQPSDTVAQMLRHLGMDRKGNEVTPKPWQKKKARKKPVAKAAEGQAAS
jgi:small subunit ribosomal protein S16